MISSYNIFQEDSKGKLPNPICPIRKQKYNREDSMLCYCLETFWNFRHFSVTDMKKQNPTNHEPIKKKCSWLALLSSRN